MARKSLRQSVASARSSSKRPPSPEASTISLPKRAKRQSTSVPAKATSTKSKYFEREQTDYETQESEVEIESPASEESGYEDPASSKASTSLEDDASGFESEEETKAPVRARGRTKTSDTAGVSKSSGKSELWRPGVKTGLGPGTQVVIKKPKAREAGSTPYTDETIHSNTMLFLKDLKANNDRQWLKMHDPDYRTSLQDFNSFLESLTIKIIGVDETIPELPVKDIVFRIYRDIRFSSDPTPYKTHFSAAWSRTGRKGPYAAYYVQIAPGSSLIARPKASLVYIPSSSRVRLSPPSIPFGKFVLPKGDEWNQAK